MMSKRLRHRATPAGMALAGAGLLLSLSLAAPAAAEDSAAPADDKLLDIPLDQLINIVTGTRDIGVQAGQSTAPIQIVDARAMAATGQNNVFDALMRLVPALSWASNYDLGNVVRSARLRGMSPGAVLVLIDGKRRHPTARVNSTPGADEGSNPVDLDLLPLALIDHVEILLDGASAQYGSDAVSGVINIILKKPAKGGALSASGGLTSRGDGGQAYASALHGMALGADGVLQASLEYRHQDFTHRTANFFGSEVPNYALDYPKTGVLIGGMNALKPLLPDLDFYAVATAAQRRGQTTENIRVTSAYNPSVPAADIYPLSAAAIYPQAFVPRETLAETDAALTAGLRGRQWAGWDWDLSLTWGRDRQDEGNIDTVNQGLLEATGSSPTAVHIGSEATSQVTTNLDLRRSVALDWLPAPVNVSFGLEHRFETYTEGAGEPASYLYGGTAALHGKSPSDASSSSRTVKAGYVDLSTRLTPQWLLGLAGRYEDYNDAGVGSNVSGKLTTRYEITPQWALRATFGNGFHAPTLAQSHFSNTVVYPAASSNGSPTLSVQLPVSSPGGGVLGEPALRPETSHNLNVGMVAQPGSQWHLTLDAYRIDLRDRIIDSGFIPGPDAPASANALALAALAANGNVILPGSMAAVQFFTNGVDTRTRGIDSSANYTQSVGLYTKINWSLDANFNQTSVSKVQVPTATLAAAGITYINPEVINDLTASTPRSHVSLAANLRSGNWSVTLRATRYGYAADVSAFAVVPYTPIPIAPAYVADVDIGYDLTDRVRLSLGGNNIFNRLPPPPPAAALDAVDRDGNRYPRNTPWGFAGAYFYVKLTSLF